MFARRPSTSESFSSKKPSTKGISKQKRSFREGSFSSKRVDKPRKHPELAPAPPPPNDNLTSPIVSIIVGPEERLFACHEATLIASPYFESVVRNQLLSPGTSKRVHLPDELPEVFSSVLEYLYKGDYYPCLLRDKRDGECYLEDGGATTKPSGVESCVVYPDRPGPPLLKDTLLYCSAERYGLDGLKKLSLRKQGLRSGVQCGTILASARYAYENTPETDSKLRAHYLALIIRSRHTFKRSGTMQMEMEMGGRLFFDLFVAMSNHVDDISSIAKSPGKSPLKSPR